eukprot:c7141_g1_i2.p1 GENE.c7141_g1_i2~~c7141_g1_i2.p1  ORF type:complete len:246 (+),score=81.19 c7141_g1_i2:39-740(+)
MSHLATFIFVFIFAWGAGKQHTANAVIINNQEVDLAITDTVYFDIAIDSQPRGRIVMGLYGNALPSAVKNFRVLCSGILGYGYKGTPIHSVVQDIFLAGGVMGHTSEGKQYGRSIYNEAIQFENVVIPFDSPGQVVMSIDKYRRGDSKFGISSSKENVPQGLIGLQEISLLVIGEVLEGMDIVWEINDNNPMDQGEMEHQVVIEDSGVIKKKKKKNFRPETAESMPNPAKEEL